MFAAMASVALVSCVKNEPAATFNEQEEISFVEPVMGPNVKAVNTVAETSVFPADGQFDVWAHYCAADPDFQNPTNMSLYMDQVTCAKDGANTYWKSTEGKYYWPTTGNLTFVAYAPTVPAVTTDFVADLNGNNKITFTGYQIPALANEDLLVSERAYACTKPGATTEADKGDANYWGGSEITFKHVLSSIVFKVKSKEAYNTQSPKYQLQVTKIEILGVQNKGEFVQAFVENQSQPAMDFNKIMWTAGGSANYVAFEAPAGIDADNDGLYDEYVAGNAVPLTTTAVYAMNNTGTRTSDASNLILLPQDIPGEAKVKVTYTIWNETMGANEPAVGQIAEATLKTTTVPTWMPGKRYTYTITIGLEEIYLDPAVASWEDGATPNEIEGVNQHN